MFDFSRGTQHHLAVTIEPVPLVPPYIESLRPYEAGRTIDLYDAAGFKYLRTITLDSDMTYESFHVLPPRSQRLPPTSPQP